MRSIGCEWMWRLAMEPRRMAHRYLVGNLVFIGHAVSDGLAKRRKSRARKLANRPAEV
jgi:UDP-N-acetyl-D-mannosaminuronic acid transferase (WecB/TagA/CpsF family)